MEEAGHGSLSGGESLGTCLASSIVWIWAPTEFVIIVQAKTVGVDEELESILFGSIKEPSPTMELGEWLVNESVEMLGLAFSLSAA
jgi:hypothetical protein